METASMSSCSLGEGQALEERRREGISGQKWLAVRAQDDKDQIPARLPFLSQIKSYAN